MGEMTRWLEVDDQRQRNGDEFVSFINETEKRIAPIIFCEQCIFVGSRLIGVNNFTALGLWLTELMPIPLTTTAQC